ncbi:MAG: L-ascorbate metabolism protein UlaG (beta-lactamase superfamily) [Candidatus Saccharimonadales bacterium]|jgi:L-ascorbate metabolism protein UlaG (beta-lactamase superfamily)
MDIEFFGANCFRIKTKKATLIIDDNLSTVGSKSITKPDNVALVSSSSVDASESSSKARLTLDSAGEFEVGDISVTAIQTRSHMDEEGSETANVYQCMFGGSSVTILGHIHPDFSDDVLELAGGTDVLIVPVGGNGYTLDSVGAVSAIKKIEPDVVIPAYYDVADLKLEVPAAPLEDFIKVSALTGEEPLDVLKVGKVTAEQTGQTKLVILNTKKA